MFLIFNFQLRIPILDVLDTRLAKCLDCFCPILSPDSCLLTPHSGHPSASFWTLVLQNVFCCFSPILSPDSCLPSSLFPHSGHHPASFWTPVLHSVFTSHWRVALCRNRLPIPIMTEFNHPKQPFWTVDSDTLDSR